MFVVAVIALVRLTLISASSEMSSPKFSSRQLIVEIFTAWRGHRPTFRSLPAPTRDSLQFLRPSLLQASTPRKESQETPGDSPTSSTRGRRRSHASILDLMARILPGGDEKRKLAVPLRTEAIDDMVSTEVAARTHPNVSLDARF